MKEFGQRLAIQVIGGIIVALAIFVITLPFKNTLEQLTMLATSIEKSVTAITEAANIDPEQIGAVSDSVNKGSKLIGDGVGDGAAKAIDKIKGALNGSE